MLDQSSTDAPAVEEVHWEGTVGLWIHNNQIICDGVLIVARVFNDVHLDIFVGHVAPMEMHMHLAVRILKKTRLGVENISEIIKAREFPKLQIYEFLLVELLEDSLALPIEISLGDLGDCRIFNVGE